MNANVWTCRWIRRNKIAPPLTAQPRVLSHTRVQMQHQMQNPENFPSALPRVLLGVIAVGLSADGWQRLVSTGHNWPRLVFTGHALERLGTCTFTIDVCFYEPQNRGRILLSTRSSCTSLRNRQQAILHLYMQYCCPVKTSPSFDWWFYLPHVLGPNQRTVGII